MLSTTKTGLEFDSWGAEDSFERLGAVLKVISHPLRLRILLFLFKKEACVKVLVEAVGSTQSNVSGHLRILLNKKIIARTRVGGATSYRLACPGISRLIYNKY